MKKQKQLLTMEMTMVMEKKDDETVAHHNHYRRPHPKFKAMLAGDTPNANMMPVALAAAILHAYHLAPRYWYPHPTPEELLDLAREAPLVEVERGTAVRVVTLPLTPSKKKKGEEVEEKGSSWDVGYAHALVLRRDEEAPRVAEVAKQQRAQAKAVLGTPHAALTAERLRLAEQALEALRAPALWRVY
jgi:hypothetical protein